MRIQLIHAYLTANICQNTITFLCFAINKPKQPRLKEKNLGSNEIALSIIQDKVVKALVEAKTEGKLFLPFRDLEERIQENLGEKEKIRPKRIREAIGALRNQGKIGSTEVARRDLFYLIEKK